MATKKEGGKNRKIGRHSRNPSSQHQTKRTEKNKANRAQKVVHTPARRNDPAISPTGRINWMMIQWKNKKERVYCV